MSYEDACAIIECMNIKYQHIWANQLVAQMKDAISSVQLLHPPHPSHRITEVAACAEDLIRDLVAKGLLTRLQARMAVTNGEYLRNEAEEDES